MSVTGIKTRIAGFNHHDGAAKTLMQTAVGARLILVPEPKNPHDANAVAVVTTAGKMLGYIPAVDAPGVLAKLLDRDYVVRCVKTDKSFNAITVTYETGDPFE